MKGPVEPVHRSVPETIQEVIELTGFLCFLFRSTPICHTGTPLISCDSGTVLILTSLCHTGTPLIPRDSGTVLIPY